MNKELTLSSNLENRSVKFRIKEVAKLKGVRVKQVAEIIGKNPTYLTNIEKGRVNTTISVVQSIADALDVPVHELVEPSDGYAHFYDGNKVWMGIRKKSE